MKSIQLAVCCFDMDVNVRGLHLYFGANKFGAQLMYNFKDNDFELNINPLGEKQGVKFKNIEIPDDCSTLFLETGSNKTFLFRTNHETDKIFVKFIKNVIEKGFPARNSDDTSIRISIANGMIDEFCMYPNKKNGLPIPLQGLKIGIQEYNSDGKPDFSDNLLRTLPITSEEFIYYDYKDQSRNFINKLYVKNNYVITETTTKTFSNELKANDLIYNFIVEIINVRLPFKSKYETQELK